MTDDAENQRLERLMRDRIVRPLPKRFYKTVSVTADQAIALDGKVVKTPLRHPLALPSQALAQAVAAEWEAQTLTINPLSMPLTKLANTAIDRAGPERAAITAEIAAFAGADLVLHRAPGPDGLKAAEAEGWDKVVAWADAAWSASFTTTEALTPAQDNHSIAAARLAAEALPPFALVATHSLATLSGSALLAFMLSAGAIAPEAAWEATILHETWQQQTWGIDAEAAERTTNRKREFLAAAAFLHLAQGA
jgi:chaperone required for assembly of F1-ATPase